MSVLRKASAQWLPDGDVKSGCKSSGWEQNAIQNPAYGGVPLLHEAFIQSEFAFSAWLLDVSRVPLQLGRKSDARPSVGILLPDIAHKEMGAWK